MAVVEWLIMSFARQEVKRKQLRYRKLDFLSLKIRGWSAIIYFHSQRSFAQQNVFHGVMGELNGKIQWGLTFDTYTIDVDILLY